MLKMTRFLLTHTLISVLITVRKGLFWEQVKYKTIFEMVKTRKSMGYPLEKLMPCLDWVKCNEF